ncbi:MAG: rifampicin phosphotransferase [Acidimicrobiaceae bacterium]
MTTIDGMTGTLEWVAPGKGDWRGLHDHFPRALTPQYQRLLEQGMVHGEGRWFADYGLPVRTLQPAFVHGRVFVTADPLVGPATNRMPPAPALWLALRVVPAFRRRSRAARRAVADRRWLPETEHWYAHERSDWERRNSAIDCVDPRALNEAELTDHVRAALANAEEGYREHFRLHGADLIPTGMYLARCADWGISDMQAAALLAGSSPASRGDQVLPRWRLVTGYDLDERCAAELPERAPVATPGAVIDPAIEDAVRAQVPAADQPEFDQLLADARATYGLRDDNGMLTGAWPVGLLRRAMVEYGRRLAQRGELADAEHAVELTVDELLAGHTRDAVTRLAERRRLSAQLAPAALGPPLELPMRAAPPAMRRVLRAMLIIRDVGFTPPGPREPLCGVGIGNESVVGRACVAGTPSEALAGFEPGDILVTVGTCPAWNAILALAGGIVTEEGGPLSHAAVIARELGLPALVGAAEAVARVPDGATIELDPVAGRVTIRQS